MVENPEKIKALEEILLSVEDDTSYLIDHMYEYAANGQKEDAYACYCVLKRYFEGEFKQYPILLYDDATYRYYEHIDHIIQLQDKQDYNEMIKSLNMILDHIAANNLIPKEEVSNFNSFGAYFEDVIYHDDPANKDKVCPSIIPFDTIYSLYAAAYFGIHKYKTALACIKEAERWNPSSCGVYYTHASILYVLGDRIGYMKQLVKGYHCAYTTKDLASFYHDIAWALSEDGDYGTALVFQSVCIHYDKTESNVKFVKELASHTNGPKDPKAGVYKKRATNLCKQFGFTFFPSKQIIDLLRKKIDHIEPIDPGEFEDLLEIYSELEKKMKR